MAYDFTKIPGQQEENNKPKFDFTTIPKPSTAQKTNLADFRMIEAQGYNAPVRSQFEPQNKILRGLSAATSGLQSGLTLGLTDALDKILPDPTKVMPQNKTEKYLGAGSKIIGSVAPINTMYGIGKAATTKLIPAAVNNVAAKTGRTILPGAITGASYGGITAVTEGKPLPDIAKQAATDAAIFAGGDLAIRGAIKGVSSLMSRRNPPAPAPDTAESFRSKISRKPEKKSAFREFYDNFRTQFVDDLAPLEKVEKNVRGKINSAENSLYKTARLFRGAPSRAHEIIRTELNPIIGNVEKQGFNYQDLGDYALAVHARDVNAAGLNSGFTDAEINAVINKYGQALEPARQQLMKFNDSLLNELANSGVIDNSLVGALKQKWGNYMPLFRNMDDGKVGFSNGLSKALVNATSPIKKLQGSNRQVIDPIEGLVKNTFQTINAAERNRVAQQVANLAVDDTSGQFVRRLPTGTNRERLNTVYVRENGEKVYYEVQPDVYKSLMNLDKESSNFLIKLLQKPASILRAGATLTPEFSFRNPIRDVAQAFIVSKSGFNPLTDFPIALVQAIGKGRPINIFGRQFNAPGQLYSQFLKDSGGFGNIVSMDRNVHKEALRQAIKETPKDKFVNILNGKSLIGLLRNIADVSETATKLGEYRASLRSGTSRPEAAYRARDIMDFARAGSSIREANKIVAFLNANIQGKSRILKGIRENPAGVTARALTAITLPSVGAYLAQKYVANDKQRQIINDSPTWLRDTFWLIPISGTDLVARVPKPFDLAPIFANLPERLIRYIDQNDPQAFDNFARETFAQYSIPVMLTGLAPFVEGMANYSFFRQAPIIPDREQDIQFVDQYDINTTETAKFLAKGVNKVTGGEGPFKNFGSPRIIDNTIRGLTAGLGSYATGAIDLAAASSGTVDKPVKPAKKVNEYPLFKSFLVNDTGGGKAMNDLYNLKEKLTKEKGSSKANKTFFTREGDLKYINNITERIGSITKIMRQIENDPIMDAETKRARMEELNKNRNNLAIQAMTRFKNSGI